MANTNGKALIYLTKADVPDMARAMYDHTKAYVDTAVKELSTDLPVRITASIDRAIRDKVDEACAVFRADMESRQRAMHEEYKTLVERLAATNEQVLADLKEWIKALPRPEVTVNVPELSQPSIMVAAPEVSITVPKLDQPNITVNTPEVNVTMPKLDQPVINVAIPELRQPTFTFEVPKLDQPIINVNMPVRKVKKKISYDQTGRPVEIEEEG